MADSLSLEQRFTEALRGIIGQWPIDPDERDDALRRLAPTSGVEVVRSAIRQPDLSIESVSLWASDRPDLTHEALVLCPAWIDLFSEEEKSIAKSRLSEKRVEWGERPERRAKNCDETWVFWIDNRPVGASRSGFADSAPQSPTCEGFARMKRIFEESGQFAASFDQRRHYRACADCSALSSLDEIVSLLDEEEFRRLRVLLAIMPLILKKPRPHEWVFVLLDFIACEFSIQPEDWVAARQGGKDEAFSGFVQSLDPFEYFGLPLAHCSTEVVQLCWPSTHGELLLPAGLGFPSEPGVLNTLISPDDWKRLQEAEDAATWGTEPGTGFLDDDRFDSFRFLPLAIEATSFRIMHWWKDTPPEYLTVGNLPELSFSPPFTFDRGDRAVASLKATLGDDTYTSLCPEALVEALEAELLYLGEDTVHWNSIIILLCRAFEHKLKQRVMLPFAKVLESSGAREFPHTIKMPLKDASKLHLGEIKAFMNYPLTPETAEFFKTRRLDSGALVNALARVHPVRNYTAHGRSYSPDEARKLRNQWLGVGRGDGGIFGALAPGRSGNLPFSTL